MTECLQTSIPSQTCRAACDVVVSPVAEGEGRESRVTRKERA